MPRSCTYGWECGKVSCQQDPGLHLVFCSQKCQAKYHSHRKHQAENPFKVEAEQFRILWRLHVSLTRQVILELAREGPESENVGAMLAELMQNQVDIGNKFARVYGKAYGDAVTSLLKEHIRLAGEVIKEVMARRATSLGQEVDLADYRAEARSFYRQWLEQAVDIAKALHAKMLPNEGAASEKFIAFMKAHIEMTLEEIVYEVNGHVVASLKTYETVLSDIIQFANFLLRVLLKQLENGAKHLSV